MFFFFIIFRCLSGMTGLMWASEKGRTAVIKVLLENRADINLQDIG